MINDYKKVLELLEKGATINYTAWGFNYPIYIESNNRMNSEKINKRIFKKLQKNKLLKLVKVDTLDYYWKLKK